MNGYVDLKEDRGERKRMQKTGAEVCLTSVRGNYGRMSA